MILVQWLLLLRRELQQVHGCTRRDCDISRKVYLFNTAPRKSYNNFMELTKLCVPVSKPILGDLWKIVTRTVLLCLYPLELNCSVAFEHKYASRVSCGNALNLAGDRQDGEQRNYLDLIVEGTESIWLLSMDFIDIIRIDVMGIEPSIFRAIWGGNCPSSLFNSVYLSMKYIQIYDGLLVHMKNANKFQVNNLAWGSADLLFVNIF